MLVKAESVLGYVCGPAASDFIQNANCLLTLQTTVDSIQLAQCNYYAFENGIYNPQVSYCFVLAFLLNYLIYCYFFLRCQSMKSANSLSTP